MSFNKPVGHSDPQLLIVKWELQVPFQRIQVALSKMTFFGRTYIAVYPVPTQRLNHLPPMRETWVRSLGREDPLEKEMVTHSSILAWEIPRTEEMVGYSQ